MGGRERMARRRRAAAGRRGAGIARGMAVAVAIALTAAAAARAGEASSPAGDAATASATTSAATIGPEITLEEAVARTLRSSWAIREEATRLDERRGVLEEALGVFDPTLFSSASFSFRQEALINGEIQPEIRRRVPLEFAAIATTEGPPGILDRAAEFIESRTPEAAAIVLRECNEFTDTRFIVDAGTEGTITLCLDANGNLHGIVLEDLAVGGDDLDRLISTLQVLELLGDEFQAETQNAIRNLLATTSSILRQFAEALRLARARLGGVPDEQELMDLTMEVGQRRLFRNGIALTATFGIVGTEDRFDDKRRSPASGGMTRPATFTSTAALRLNVPLGRGRGRVATYGNVEAATEAVRAEQELVLHIASQEALGTIRAYWDVAAAEARVGLRERSRASRAAIRDRTQELIDASELPGVESARATSRLAEAERQLADARRQLVEARLELVRTMGESVDGLGGAPLAADSLPVEEGSAATTDPAATAAELSSLFERARLERHDLAAAAAATRATAILRDVARADLRRQLDLALRVSFDGFEESFDTRIYQLRGYWEAIDGRITGPSYAIGLRWNLPFANRAARGRLLRAESQLAQSEVTEGDLGRQVRLRLAEIVATLARRRAEAARLRETLGNLEQSLQATSERFGLGDATLLDVQTTEQQLTDARLALLEAERDIATLEAEARFESGTLLEEPAEGVTDPAALRLAPGL